MAFSSSTGHLSSASGESCFWQSSTTSPDDRPAASATRIHLDPVVCDDPEGNDSASALGNVAILEDCDRFAGRHVVTIVCGSNVDMDLHRGWVDETPDHDRC